jgi:hypothetical protein
MRAKNARKHETKLILVFLYRLNFLSFPIEEKAGTYVIFNKPMSPPPPIYSINILSEEQNSLPFLFQSRNLHIVT